MLISIPGHANWDSTNDRQCLIQKAGTRIRSSSHRSAPGSIPLFVVTMRCVVSAGTHARICRPLGRDWTSALLRSRCRDDHLYGFDRGFIRDNLIVDRNQPVGLDCERRGVFRIKTVWRLGRCFAGKRCERPHADQERQTDQADKRKPNRPSHHRIRVRIKRKKRLSMSGAA